MLRTIKFCLTDRVGGGGGGFRQHTFKISLNCITDKSFAIIYKYTFKNVHSQTILKTENSQAMLLESGIIYPMGREVSHV